MGFIFILIFVLIAVSEMVRMQEQTKIDKVEADKWCPPHKWRAQETKDSEGNVIKYSITCELCGPLKPLE